MAKVSAPLFSFGASGKLGNALVFGKWKGLDVVRRYVVPANPDTTAQGIQRGFMIAAVAMVHAAEIAVANPLIALDQAALNLWGTIFPSPRTWFNQFCKMYFDQHVAGLKAAIFRGCVLTPAAGQITVAMTFDKEGANDVTTVNIKYGTSKTNLINTLAATKAELAAGKAVAGLVDGTKYYFQIQPTAHVDFVGSYSGIYFATAGV